MALMTTSVVVIIVILIWRVLNWVWFKPKKLEKKFREQGLNGNSYKLLFGDMKEIAKMSKEAESNRVKWSTLVYMQKKIEYAGQSTIIPESNPIGLSDDIVPRVLPFIHKSIKIHGKTFFAWLGPRPMVHIMEPELMKEMLTKYNIFQKQRGGNPLGRRLAKGLFDTEGEQWAKHKKIINPAFHTEKLKNMLPAFYVSCMEMIEEWEEIISKKDGSCELDIWPYLQTMTSDVISRTAFGSSYKEGRKISELQKEQVKLVVEFSRSVYIPGSRFLPTKNNTKMKELVKEVNASVKGIIEKRLKAMKVGEATSNDDLLGLLLQSNNKEIQQHGNKNFGLSIDDIIEECKLFYFAGQETTANLLAWTMILLSQHPYWQEKAREEVINLFGDKKPDQDGLNHLKIINMVFNEALRLYPPAITLGRMIHEEITVGKYTLPAGVFIQLPVMILHHDRELWGDDADKFKPERFSEGILKATNGNFSYLPFGWGPRICIGQNFAMMEAKMAMAIILQRFSFTLSPSYSHAPKNLATLQPQYGAHLIISKRC